MEVMFNAVKGFYEDGIYTADNVRTCIGTWITQEQCQEILNPQQSLQHQSQNNN